MSCTYQTPGQGTSLESDQWPSNAPSHSSTASWCTGQGGPRHSGPRSEQGNTSQSAGLQRGRGEEDAFSVSSPCSQSLPVPNGISSGFPMFQSDLLFCLILPDHDVLQKLHLEHIKAVGPGLIPQY